MDIHPGAGQKIIGVRALRWIYPGEELYINYGPKYWSEQNSEPTPPPEVNFPDEVSLKSLKQDLDKMRIEMRELKLQMSEILLHLNERSAKKFKR